MRLLAPTHYLAGLTMSLLLLFSSSCGFAPNRTTTAPIATNSSNNCSTGASLINPATRTIQTGAATPSAKNPQTGGIGGTGQIALRPGIGGTGQAEAITAGNIVDSGGSGGIGGTGIVGVITGFASICVNGAEVHYTVSTPVTSDGMPSDVAELLVGQVVAVRAARSEDSPNGPLQAQGIAVQHAAIGPLTGLDINTGEFSVMGQAGVALQKLELSNLKLDDWVRVSGHRLENGLIKASRVQALAAPPPGALVRGPVIKLDDHYIQVGSTKVRLREKPTGLESGREILVRGQWNGHYLTATHITVAPTRTELGVVRELRLQGYVRELRDQELVLNDETLRLSKQTIVTHGAVGALKVNQFIQAQGHLEADGRVTIDHLDLGGEPYQVGETIPSGPEQRNKALEKRGDQKGADSSHGNQDGRNGGPSGNGAAGR